MNRYFSYNWLKEYVPIKLPAKSLAAAVSLSGPSVERLAEQVPQFTGVVTAKTLEVKQHPNADRLRIVTVTIDPTIAKADTWPVADQQKVLEIVCGAPNVAANQIVPLALVGARVGDMTIQSAALRGVVSNGMICSLRELGLGEEHDGILVLPTDTPVGQPLEKVIPIHDFLLDVEVTTNRPDAMSTIGMAREISAITGTAMRWKEPKPPVAPKKSTQPLTVTVSDRQACKRYMAAVMTNIVVGPSPLWLQHRLRQLGQRPINNLVDITNYVMWEYGQPLHIFDYDQISDHKIIVRRARAGEDFASLEQDQNYKLTTDDLVIADGDRPQALAGIKGGRTSGVTQNTRTIVIESANFHPLVIRQMGRRHNIRTEAGAFHEKNLSAHNPALALYRTIQLVQELAGGQLANKLIDVHHQPLPQTVISFDPTTIAAKLGVDLPAITWRQALQRLGCVVTGTGRRVRIRVPWWRIGDLNGSHDIMEEIARIYGYHKIPPLLPMTTQAPESRAPLFTWEDRIKDLLVGAGYSELISYSLVGVSDLDKVGASVDQTVALHNPLNEDFSHLRPTIAGGLLQAVADNQASVATMQLFELSNIYTPQKNDLPIEQPELGVVVAGKQKNDDYFYQLKGAMEFLLQQLHVTNWQWSTEVQAPVAMPALGLRIGKEQIGWVGVVAPAVAQRYGFKVNAAMAVCNVSALAAVASAVVQYNPPAKFPASERDIALLVDRVVLWKDVAAMIAHFDPLITEAILFDQYLGSNVPADKKSLGIRVTYRADDRTLTSAEVDNVHNRLSEHLQQKLGAAVRGQS